VKAQPRRIRDPAAVKLRLRLRRLPQPKFQQKIQPRFQAKPRRKLHQP
jgi:hypothetical protein